MYTPSPPASARAMERSSSILGPSCSQPLPFAATLSGTTTCSAWPSLAGIGPWTWPPKSLTPAKRRTSAATLAWSAGVTAPSARSYTTSAGKTSLGVNRLARSTTWVDSALLGSHSDASFCWALLSLPASGPATATTAIQKACDPPRCAHAALKVRCVVAAGNRAPGGLPKIPEYSHCQISDHVLSSGLQIGRGWLVTAMTDGDQGRSRWRLGAARRDR